MLPVIIGFVLILAGVQSFIRGRPQVQAGPQTIGVAFLNKSYAANEDLVKRPVSSTYDVFIGMQYGYTTAPHLSRVVITGPYKPTGISEEGLDCCCLMSDFLTV